MFNLQRKTWRFSNLRIGHTVISLLTFELLEKQLSLPPVIKNEGLGNEFVHWKSRRAVFHGPGHPLVLSQREQQAQFVCDQVTVGNVVHELLSFAKSVVVQTAFGLRPTQLEVVVSLVQCAFPTHVGESCVNSGMKMKKSKHLRGFSWTSVLFSHKIKDVLQDMTPQSWPEWHTQVMTFFLKILWKLANELLNSNKIFSQAFSSKL